MTYWRTNKVTDDSLFLMRPMGCPSARLPGMPPAGIRVFEVGLPQAMSVPSNPSAFVFFSHYNLIPWYIPDNKPTGNNDDIKNYHHRSKSYATLVREVK